MKMRREYSVFALQPDPVGPGVPARGTVQSPSFDRVQDAERALRDMTRGPNDTGYIYERSVSRWTIRP